LFSLETKEGIIPCRAYDEMYNHLFTFLHINLLLSQNKKKYHSKQSIRINFFVDDSFSLRFFPSCIEMLFLSGPIQEVEIGVKHFPGSTSTQFFNLFVLETLHHPRLKKG
jgi:hypothetical protein